MMDFPLTLPTILRRAETYFRGKEIVTRLPDRSFHRYTYADFGRRARRLAVAFTATHAGDRAVIVDASLLPLLDLFKDRTQIEHVFVIDDSYEDLLASADPDAYEDPGLDESEAAAMCYTSGTTGMPKGVVYSHRSTVLHTLGVAAANPLA